MTKLESEKKAPAPIARFPHSRVKPATAGGFRELGMGKLARGIGADKGQIVGHWCGRCRGIWYGLAFEVECPACGNRNG
ncbi:MAG: hypothetical protein OXF82_00885 [Gammaproteobacteria bacterium]|nr:hypothetical protein [Gammaproteobacteria bacterium]